MTASKLYDRLIEIFPDFAAYRNSADNIFKEDNDSHTSCGVFAQLSHFVRERFESLQPSALSALGTLIDHCLATQDGVLSDAATTCFLETLIAEPFTPALITHLGPRGEECIRELWGRAV